MIDTIRGYIEIKPTSKPNLILKALIENTESVIKRNFGFTAIIKLSNFTIKIKLDSNFQPNRLSFYGSLSKFYYGNNLAQLDWETTESAINMLSDNIGLNMGNAIITRIDFGLNVNVKNPVHEYISSLLNYPRLETIRYNSSVTFSTRHSFKSLIFYDKLKEIKDKSKETYLSLPDIYLNKFILRYEIRLKRRLNHTFKLKTFRLKSILRKNIQNKMIKLLINDYSKIVKNDFGKDPIYLINQHNGLFKYLSYHGITKLGFDRITNTIHEVNFNTANDSSKRSKLKNTIKQLLNGVDKNTLEKNLIKELDTKIELSRIIIS